MRLCKQYVWIAIFLLLGFLQATAVRAGEIKGTVTVQGLRSAENIAVYVDAIPGKTFDAPTKHAEMDQEQMKFKPHVIVVLKGTTVDFLNSDHVGHNVFWPAVGKNKKLGNNLGNWPYGVKRPFTFNDLGDVSLLCNVHPEMSGYVVVVPTPYFAVANKEGEFEIKDVPPGHYTLKTWSEEGKPTTQPVEVTSGTVTVNLTVHR